MTVHTYEIIHNVNITQCVRCSRCVYVCIYGKVCILNNSTHTYTDRIKWLIPPLFYKHQRGSHSTCKLPSSHNPVCKQLHN